MSRIFSMPVSSLRIFFQLFLISILFFLIGCKKDDVKPPKKEENKEEEVIKDLPKKELIHLLEKNSGGSEGESFFNKNIDAVKNNPNVDDAYLTTNELIVKTKGDSVYHVYPKEYLESPFESGDTSTRSLDSSSGSSNRSKSYKTTGRHGKVAVFNYFSDDKRRKGQNDLIDNLCDLFQKHAYGVEYYPAEKFNLKNIHNVSANSADYEAVIIISEGVVDAQSGVSYYAVFEEYKEVIKKFESTYGEKYNAYMTGYHYLDKTEKRILNEKPNWLIKLWNGDKYNFVLPVKLLEFKNTLLYIGACSALSRNVTAQSVQVNYPPNTSVIGWDGVNSLSQAHVALLFNRILDNGYSLTRALKSVWATDFMTGAAVHTRLAQDYLDDTIEFRHMIPANLHEKAYAHIDNPTEDYQLFISSFWKDYVLTLNGKIKNTSHRKIKRCLIELVPLSKSQEFVKKEIKIKKDGSFKVKFNLPRKLNGLYNVTIRDNTKKSGKSLIRLGRPISFLYSDKFLENFAEFPEENKPGELSVDKKELQLSVGQKGEIVILGGSEKYSLKIDETIASAVLEQKAIDSIAADDDDDEDDDDEEDDNNLQYKSIIVLTGKKIGETSLEITDKVSGKKELVKIVVESGIPPTVVSVKGVNLVLVEGGSFKFKNKFDISLSDYYIGQTEVTQGQWKSVMGSLPPQYAGEDDDFPVTNVTRIQILEFLRKLNNKTGKHFRLPTLAEWQFAAKGGTRSKGYKYSGSDNLDEVAWTEKNSGGSVHKVAQKKQNELSLYDMTGNVHEQCLDSYMFIYEKNVKTRNPLYIADNYDNIFFICGGSFYNDWLFRENLDDYGYVKLEEEYANYGFRVVMVDNTTFPTNINTDVSSLSLQAGGIGGRIKIRGGSGQYVLKDCAIPYCLKYMVNNSSMFVWLQSEHYSNTTAEIIDLIYNLETSVNIIVEKNTMYTSREDSRIPLAKLAKNDLAKDRSFVNNLSKSETGVFEYYDYVDEKEFVLPSGWKLLDIVSIGEILPAPESSFIHGELGYLRFDTICVHKGLMESANEDIRENMLDVSNPGDGKSCYAIRSRQSKKNKNKIAYMYEWVENYPEEKPDYTAYFKITARFIGDEDISVENLSKEFFKPNSHYEDVVRYFPFNLWKFEENGEVRYSCQLAGKRWYRIIPMIWFDTKKGVGIQYSHAFGVKHRLRLIKE